MWGADTVDLSIIVVNWNVKELLRACLRSVFDNTGMDRARFEVVVVDNDSADGSAEMVSEEFPHVRLVANSDNVGFGKANNQALPLCRGRYVLLLNPDTEVHPGALDDLMAYAEAHPDIGALGCRLLNSDGSYQRWTAGVFPSVWSAARHAFFIDLILPEVIRGRSLYLSEDVQDPIDVEWVSGACMLLRREALGATIFDEQFFMYGEDNELCERLAKAGWRVTYAPVATVTHHHGKSMAKQSGTILLSSFKGPRAFFIHRQGTRWVWLYDLLIATGFGLRWAIYRVASFLPGGRRFSDKAAAMWSHFTRASQVMYGK